MVVDADGSVFRARRLLLAHGLCHERPPLEGIEALWGSGAFHCPHCDGWEVRDRPLAFYARDRGAVENALLLTGWTRDLVLCTNGAADILASQRAVLARAQARLREERITRLVAEGSQLKRIEFFDGPPEERSALFFLATLRQPNRLAETLGCQVTDLGTIATDEDGRTHVAGVFAAGDASARVRSVAIAIGMGARTGKVISAELIYEALKSP